MTKDDYVTVNINYDNYKSVLDNILTIRSNLDSREQIRDFNSTNTKINGP